MTSPGASVNLSGAPRVGGSATLGHITDGGTVVVEEGVSDGDLSLDSLLDVETAGAVVGDVLTRESDTRYRPHALAHTEVVDEPTSVVLFTHRLAFAPAAIECVDTIGNRRYPREILHLSPQTVQCNFLRDFRGTIRVS